MEALWKDVSYGARMLWKSPGFTLVAIISLAIGIGANSAIFSVTNALLLRPLPYADADRMVILWTRSPGLNVAQDWFSPGQYLDVKTQNQVFDLTAITIGGSYNLTGLDQPERVDAAKVSSSFFPLFGAQPMLGRVFTAEEDEPGQPPAVILNNGFWRRRFGSDPTVVGRSMTLNGNLYTVVGVMPPDFALNKEVLIAVSGIQNADLLLPMPMNEQARSDRAHEDYNIYGRLKPGVTVEQAKADLALVAGRMKQDFPENYPPNGGLTIDAVPLLEQVVGDVRLALYVLLGAVGFVLLTACANVANLLLVRASIRQKEIAVRTAVGASRARVVRQLLTESVLLSLAGGLAGVAVAYVAIMAMRVLGPGTLPRIAEIGLDGRVLAFTFVVSLLTGVVFGLAPALRSSQVDLNGVLKDGGRTSVGGGAFGLGHQKLRRLLIVSEIALSLMLLIGAGLLIRSYQRVSNADPGFDPNNVLSLRLALPNTKYNSPELVTGFYRQLNERVAALPGVESVGTNYLLPLSSSAVGWEPIEVDGYVPPNQDDMIISNARFISPGYLTTMRIALIEGRDFDDRDVKGAEEVCIVNRQFAERFWPNESPIGKRVQRGSAEVWRTVVGVVADEKEYNPDAEPPITLYHPINQISPGSRYLVARTASNPSAMAASIAREIHALDPDLPVFDVATMEQRLLDSLARRRFSMLLLGALGAIALVLAAVGIYGVMAFSVDQRTHEIGIRMALGARRFDILGMVLRQALVLVALGVAAGLAGAYVVTRVMSSLLFEVSATDGLTFGLVPLVLAGIALVASSIPARRATRVDPMVALRHE